MSEEKKEFSPFFKALGDGLFGKKLNLPTPTEINIPKPPKITWYEDMRKSLDDAIKSIQNVSLDTAGQVYISPDVSAQVETLKILKKMLAKMEERKPWYKKSSNIISIIAIIVATVGVIL